MRLLVSVQWSFLRYFAIAAERRNQARPPVLGAPSAGTAKQVWPTRIIVEVEDPGDAAGDEAERAIRARRISFWTACGARLLQARGYVLPDYTASGTTEPMLLMAATPAALPSVQGNVLRRLVLAIYTDRYGMAPNDSLVSRALASIAPG